MENKYTSEELKTLLAPSDLVEYTFGGDVYNLEGDIGEVGSIEVANTYRLQMTSLLCFAQSLGYFQDEMDILDGRFGAGFLSVQGNAARSRVSFDTMVKWHNTCFMPSYSHGMVKELPMQSSLLGFDIDLMINAIKSKLVKRVYLQCKVVRARKSALVKDVVVQRHIISFV